MTKFTQSLTWVMFVVLAFSVGAFAGISDEHRRGQELAGKVEQIQSETLVAITTIVQCGKPKALILSKGDGAQLILSPVLANVANALYAQVPEGFAITLELPCFTST